MDQDVIEQIRETIRLTVNGKVDAISSKIDMHNKAHEEDMRRILPVLEAYENAQKGGRAVMWTAGTVTVLGTAWIVVKQIFPSI